jgi:hydroxypyruvate isomerase
MNKQLQQNLSVRELTKILFNTLKDENGLAIRMIVRDYNKKQMENKNVKQIRNMATNSSI